VCDGGVRWSKSGKERKENERVQESGTCAKYMRRIEECDEW